MHCRLPQPGLWDDAKVIAPHQQDKQCEGQPDAQREHFDGAISLTFILDEKIQGAGKAAKNEDNEQQGKNAHDKDQSAKFQSNRITVSVHMPKLKLGEWGFAPTLWPTLAALFFFVLTMWLGNWQSERAETKRALQARYDAALEEAPIHVGNTLLDRDSVLYRRVEVEGTFDDAHTILLDNRVFDGVAGYHVLTPFKIKGSRLAILVNRGWIATGRSRDQLPLIPAPQGLIKLVGVATDPHSRYVELMHGTSQGRVWQNLDFERFTASYGSILQPVLLLQTSQAEDGLVRDWPRPDTGISMHVSYAVQWYSLAATLAVLWLVLNVKRHRGDGR
jgi:surfeit locus 1 family protein